jgi:hypothetical protein
MSTVGRIVWYVSLAVLSYSIVNGTYQAVQHQTVKLQAVLAR